MAMPDVARRWTRAEVLALPEDGNRYELVDGELLVSPSPATIHQRAVWALYDRVAPYVKAHRLGITGLAPADLDLESEDSLQPDLFVLDLQRMPAHWSEVGIPRLVSEVLSPSTARYDRVVKRPRYQRARIPEYWIVDTDARLFERWRPGDERPEVLTGALTWQPDATVPPLVVDLPEYFAEVLGEVPPGSQNPSGN
jgi:Uma2 family endonuclease